MANTNSIGGQRVPIQQTVIPQPQVQHPQPVGNQAQQIVPQVHVQVPPPVNPQLTAFRNELGNVAPAQLSGRLQEIATAGFSPGNLFRSRSTILENQAQRLESRLATVQQHDAGNHALIAALQGKISEYRAEATLEKANSKIDKSASRWGATDLSTKSSKALHFLGGITGISSTVGFFTGFFDGVRQGSVKNALLNPWKNLFGGLANIACPFTHFAFGVTSNRDRTEQYMSKLAKAGANTSDQRLSDAQIQAYQTLSATPSGQATLQRMGMMNTAQVQTARQNLTTLQINQLSPIQQLQVESLTSQQIQVVHSRGTWAQAQQECANLGFGHMNRAVLTNMSHAAHMDKEQTLWAATIANPGGAHPQERQAFLQRLFHVMQEGGLQSRQTAPSGNNPGTGWQQWPHSVCTAISRGGRVVLTLPEGEEGQRMAEWLMGTPQQRERIGLNSRFAATHGMEIGQDVDAGHNKLKEKKGFTAGMGVQHFGMNLPIGGMGAQDMNGNPVTDQGNHGHLYMGYQPPTDGRPGTIMIGLEGTGPSCTSMYGAVHSARGRSDPFSPTMSQKWRDVTDVQAQDRPANYGGMTINLRTTAQNVQNSFAQLNPQRTAQQLVGPRLTQVPVSNPETMPHQVRERLINEREQTAQIQRELLQMHMGMI